MNQHRKTNYSVEGLDAASKQFYYDQETRLTGKFAQLKTNSGINKPAKPAKPANPASLTKQFSILSVKSNHPPEERPGLHENRTGSEVTVQASSGNGPGFDEMSPEVTVQASSGNGPGFDRTVFDGTVFDGSAFGGTGVDSFFFYGIGRDETNHDGMKTAPAPAPATVFDNFERPIIPQPSRHGGKKRKSKRMKTRYRKKYKGKRSNKTRRYRK